MRYVFMGMALVVVMGQGVVAEGLDALVRRAEARSPVLAAGAAEVEESRARRSEARAQRWPRLWIDASAARSDNPLFAFGALLDQRRVQSSDFNPSLLNDPGYRTNVKTAARLGVPIFTGFDIDSFIRQGDIGVSLAETAWEARAQGVRYETVEAGLAVLRGRAVVMSLDDRLASSAEEIAGAKRLRARGLVLGSDYFAAEALLAGMKARRIQAAKAMDAAQARLNERAGGAVVLAGTPSTTALPTPSREELLTAALARPDVRLADRQSDMAEVLQKKDGRTILPRVDALASAETNTDDFSSNPSNRLLMLRAQWSLGDPASGARRAAASARSEAARHRRESAREDARLQVLQALAYFDGARESLPMVEESVDRARKSLEMFRPLYREGRQSLLDVVRAEDALAQAEAARAQTLEALHQGWARVMWAAGRLDADAVRRLSEALR
jgi:outer membrane protein TolC